MRGKVEKILKKTNTVQTLLLCGAFPFTTIETDKVVKNYKSIKHPFNFNLNVLLLGHSDVLYLLYIYRTKCIWFIWKSMSIFHLCLVVYSEINVLEKELQTLTETQQTLTTKVTFCDFFKRKQHRLGFSQYILCDHFPHSSSFERNSSTYSFIQYTNYKKCWKVNIYLCPQLNLRKLFKF